MAINTFQSPGIQINEVNLTNTTQGVNSYNTVCLLPAETGEAMKLVSVTNESDLVNKFGLPQPYNYQLWFQIWNYLQYASSMFVIRPIDSLLTSSNFGIGISGTYNSGTEPNILASTDSSASSGSDILSNITQTIVPRALQNLYNTDIASVTLSTYVTANLIEFYNKYVTTQPNIAISVFANPSSWNSPIQTNITGQIFDSSLQPTLTNVVTFSEIFPKQPNWAAGEFGIIVFQKNSKGLYSLVESFIVNINKNALNQNGTNYFADTYINSSSNYIYCKTNLGGDINKLTLIHTQNIVPISTPPSNVGTAVPASSLQEGDYYNAYNLISQPEETSVALIIQDPVTGNGAINVATSRQDCIAIVAPYDYTNLVSKTSSQATQYLVSQYGLNSINFENNNTYTAVYGNMKYMYDKFNNINSWVGIAGDVAGLFSYNFANGNPWDANAGVPNGVIKNVIKLAFNPSLSDRNLLYTNLINPVRSIPGEGNAVIWGQKTWSNVSTATGRLNVRQLLNYLKTSLRSLMELFVFQINDAFVQTRVISTLDPFMRNILGNNGVYYYKIFCDSTNNPPNIIDSNMLVVDLYIQPTKISEFIQVNLNIENTGITITTSA